MNDNAQKQKPVPAPPVNMPKKEEPAVKNDSLNKKPDVAVIKPQPQPAKEYEPSKEASSSIVGNDNNLPVRRPVVSDRITKLKADSIQIARKPEAAKSVYTNNPAEPHYVVFVLNKVDPVYATEARNAFNRYNRESYASQNLELSAVPLNDDIKLILFKSFSNASTALDHISRARKITQTDIIPWLTVTKYSFVMITQSSLDVLMNTKDLASYKQFLNQLYPGQF